MKYIVIQCRAYWRSLQGTGKSRRLEGVNRTSIFGTLIIMAILGVYPFFFVQAQQRGDTTAVTGKKGSLYPAFVFRNAQGEINSAELEGKVLWINFWFEACKPCMAEMDAIAEFSERFSKRQDFVMISLTWEGMDAIQRVRSKYPMPYSVFSISENACTRLNGGRGYPTNVVVDKEGVIRYIETGGKTEPLKAREDIQQFIIPVIEEALKK